jgi:DNA-binding NtrC family response regulator
VQQGDNAAVALVVDDDQSMRLLCRVNLELDGFRVVEAANLDEARSLLDSEPVSIVLLDLTIGLERGDTLLDEIRGRELRIPVVLVTGSATVDSGELRVDADAVLAKPFTIDELTSIVHRLTGGRAELPL